MGYFTSLYAVDIAELAGAIGSQDSSLLAKLQAATVEDPKDGEVSPALDLTSLRSDSTLRIANEGILLDDQPITVDKVAEALSSSGITILDVIVHYPSRVTQSVLTAIHECFPDSGIEKILLRYECDDPKIAKSMSPGPFLFRPLPEDKEEDHEETDTVIASFTHVSHEAISDLVSGNLSRTSAAHGSALEVFCHVLGTRLPDGGMIGDLSPLELNLLLEHVRHPVPIAAYGDFPVISHLTAHETAQEAKRLSKIRIAYPDDPDIEEARKILRTCIKNAASQGRGVVSFYQ
jgi:hypothetical protein